MVVSETNIHSIPVIM